jgi:hypothetical protein
VLDDDARHGTARLVGLELHDLGVRPERDVRVFERGPNAEHLGVRLRVHDAREPSQFAQRTHALYGGFDSSSMIPHGAWNGW